MVAVDLGENEKVTLAPQVATIATVIIFTFTIQGFLKYITAIPVLIVVYNFLNSISHTQRCLLTNNHPQNYHF